MSSKMEKERDRAQKSNLMRNAFRRSSSSEQGGREYIESKDMILILNRLGQPVNERELNKYIDSIDVNHTGHLDYEGFSKVCGKFLKEPAALEKFRGDEFAFKHLINLTDFEHP